jgi:hypothetical protein
MPFLLCFTVLASVSFGVLSAYVVVIGILSMFGRARQPEPVRPQLVLVPSHHPVSGD